MTARLSLALVAAAALFADGGALAQSSPPDACAGLPTQAEEIACLRGALQESRAAQARERDAAPVPQDPPSVAVQQDPATPRSRVPEQMGAEQVRATQRDPGPAPERLHALATLVKTDHLGLVTLRLDNGQVWQQAEARGVPLRLGRDRAYPVEISASGFGGYRMNFTDFERQIVVTRRQ